MGKAELSALPAELHWSFEPAASLEMKAGFFSKKEFSKFVPNCQSFDWLCQNLLVSMWAVGLGWHWRLLDWPALGLGGDNKDTCVQTTKTPRKNEDSLEFL